MMPELYPKALYVSGSSIQVYEDEPWDEIDKDPRGVLLMWETPRTKAKYIMGMDPTQGITGWSRGTRTENDYKVDNGAIEIFRVDGEWEHVYKEVKNPSGQGTIRIPDIDPTTRQHKKRYKDVQVAEFAAPCDAVELARVANVLGRIYSGEDEDQCELIWESWPGPGILSTQELLRLQYGNLWHWEYIDSEAEDSGRLGWRSHRESQKMLWYRSRRHLVQRRVRIRSKYLLAEYADAEIDMDKMRARAAYGKHDDRLQAANMCYWAGHKWTYEVERSQEPVTTSPFVDYQTLGPGLEDYESFSDWKSRIVEEMGS